MTDTPRSDFAALARELVDECIKCIRTLGVPPKKEWVIEQLTTLLSLVVQEREAQVREECAKIAERTYPRGSAHTYASENADRYITQEDCAEYIARRIRKGDTP